ncbi:MAG: large-conductance mechanosensitive channel protein MscL [Bacteroidota bacterium]
MGFIKEFKEFAIKGNLVDTAIAFVMGAAFGKVVSAFVEKMFAPIVGLLLGGVDLADKKLIVKEGVAEVKDTTGAVVSPAIEEVAIQWGSFITAAIDFIVVAFVMFLIIKAMNKMKKAEEPAPAAPAGPTQEQLLGEIRDLLKK